MERRRRISTIVCILCSRYLRLNTVSVFSVNLFIPNASDIFYKFPSPNKFHFQSNLPSPPPRKKDIRQSFQFTYSFFILLNVVCKTPRPTLSTTAFQHTLYKTATIAASVSDYVFPSLVISSVSSTRIKRFAESVSGARVCCFTSTVPGYPQSYPIHVKRTSLTSFASSTLPTSEMETDSVRRSAVVYCGFSPFDAKAGAE